MITVITNQKINNSDLIITNFYYNYLYNDIIYYNKIYINDLLKVDIISAATNYNKILNQYLLDNKNIIIKKIKIDDYSFLELYNFISNYNKKIKFLSNFNKKLLYNDDTIFNNLIYNPIMITFFETNLIKELYKIDNYIINSILVELKILISNEKYKLILNKYSNIIFLNYPKFNNNIPSQYKLLYQFKILNNYILELNNFTLILVDLYHEVSKLFNNILTECTIYQINNIINEYEYCILYIYNYSSDDDLMNISLTLIKKLNDQTNDKSVLDVSNNFFELLKLINNINKYKYYYLIMEDVTFVNKFCDFIHYYIYNDFDYIFTIIINTLNLYTNIKVEKNKELFFKLYHEKLIIRFLSNTFDISKEKKLINIINQKCKSIEINKINNVLDDIEMNKPINNNFLKLYFDNNCNNMYSLALRRSGGSSPLRLVDLPENDIITLSYSNWNINFNQGYFIVKKNILSIDMSCTNNTLIYILHEYNKYYEFLNNYNKTLLWLLHQGEIIIEYMSKDIKMLPIQFLLFDIIYNNDIDTQDLLKSEYLVDYSEIFRINLINSLIISNIIISDKNILKLNITNNFETNLIIIFQKYNHKLIEKKVFTFDKSILLKSHINHIIKKEPYTFEKLFHSCQDKFNVDCELFTQTIDKMISQDYIILKEDMYHKLF